MRHFTLQYYAYWFINYGFPSKGIWQNLLLLDFVLLSNKASMPYYGYLFNAKTLLNERKSRHGFARQQTQKKEYRRTPTLLTLNLIL